MAEIYLGTHAVHGRVAIKVMRGLLERDLHQLARFKREAEVVGELRHPNIVRMLDYYVEDDTPCIVMEYVPGPSLASYLKTLHAQKQRVPIAIVARLLRSIAHALDYAHSQGVIHRDIKPANVLLRSPSQPIELGKPLPPDVEPILTDFGLVRLLDSTMHTTSGAVAGTPAYMSPEQARGEKVDHRTDIYSLGILLYELLAGQVPFQADTTFGMLMKHINEPPPPIKGISDDLQALLDRALAKDPAMRYATAGEMANEFMAIFNGETISPATLEIAEAARKASSANQVQPKIEAPFRTRWIRLGLELIMAVTLAVVILQLMYPSTSTVAITPQPQDPNIPIGKARFSDFNNVMDRISITLTRATPPQPGTHYEVWLIGSEGTPPRDIGAITFDTAGTGQLVFTDPDQQNLLQLYHHIQITVEQDGVEVTQPDEEIAYSSIFPPQALVHVRNVLTSYNETPANLALMQGLYYYSASYINASVHGDPLDPDFVGLIEAFANGDEATVRKRTEEVINLIVGDQSDLYKDYDQDGVFDNNGGDGFGSLPNGSRAGYLQETFQQLKLASDATDSTPNIRLYSENIRVCIQNMDGWTNRILSLALELMKMPFGAEMETSVTELSILTENLLRGQDVDKNGLVEPLPGECGADLAYEHGWYLADMPILIGPERIPSSGK